VGKVFNRRGSVNVIIVLIFSLLIGVAAIVTDVGLSYYEVETLQHSLDLATLAGALELPKDPTEAENQVLNYMNMNFPEVKYLSILITNSNKEIEVYGSVTVEYKFSRIMGIKEKTFSRRAKVILAPLVSSFSGIRPLVIESQTLEFGDEVILKEGAFESSNGNFGAVALGGNGATIFRDNILYGYKGTITVGDHIPTEPGNMSSVINPLKNYLKDDKSTFDNFERTSKRLWVVPVIDSFDVSGRDHVEVVGFAQFFIGDIGKQSGQTKITGRFVKYVNSGEIDVNAVDNGVYGSKLVD
jgi:hypothetical protein